MSLSPYARLVSRRLSSPHAPRERREINFQANIQSTLKRTKSLIQSFLNDFICQPGNLFQGGCVRMVQDVSKTDKECLETKFWLNLLKDTNYISLQAFNSIYTDADEISKILFSILKSSRLTK